MKKLNIAIIGQGRSGRNIHGSFFKSENNTKYNVVAVVEIDEERRNRALEEYPGCKVYSCYTELYGRTDIDLVVNASMSMDHYEITKDLLKNKFNVVVEKPFARNRYECDNLIKIANENNVVLGVFQQSLFAPFFVKTKEIIASGKLGEIKQIDITYNGFNRRYDWQTTQVKMGGNIYNTGPHPIGYALSYLDFDPDFKVVFSKLDHVLSSGDSDDYAKIIITAPNKPIIDIEVSSNDAYPAATLKILGSLGTLKATQTEYEMTYIIEGESPEQELIITPLKNEEGLPIYCKDTLVKHEEKGEFSGTAFNVGPHKFYDMMYNKIVNNEELEIKPEYAAMVISVIEQVHAENPLPIKY